MDPAVSIFSEPNFKGEVQSFKSFGKHKLKITESITTDKDLFNKTFYVIHPVKVNNKEYALDNSGKNLKGGVFHLWEWSKDNVNQIFTLLPNGTLKCVGNSFVMDMGGGAFKDGAFLQCYPQNNTDAQLWTYDGTKQMLKLKNKPFCLNIHNNVKQNGATLNVWTPNGHDSQKWIIRFCEVKTTFVTNNFVETFTVNYNVPNIVTQREAFNTCQAIFWQHGCNSGESTGWVGIGDYNYNTYTQSTGTADNVQNRGYLATSRGYSTQFSNTIGDFKWWVGKKFIIRCVQDQRFVWDARNYRIGNNGSDNRRINLWQYGEGNENQIWTIDMYGHLTLACDQRIILTGGLSHQGGWPLLDNNQSGRLNGNRWRYSDGNIGHLGMNVFLHANGARMANGTFIGCWHDQRARPQANCRWVLQEVGTDPNWRHSLGYFKNDDVSAVTLKPFTDVFIYQNNFSGHCQHLHNGTEQEWCSGVQLNDQMSSYKVRAGAMDGQKWSNNSDTSGTNLCGIRYAAHIVGQGWTAWYGPGMEVGKVGQVIDAMKFEYIGPGQMYARAHIGNVGWMDWVTSGVVCGVENGNLSNQRLLQALQFKIDGASNVLFALETYGRGRGWLSKANLMQVGGTTGQSLPLEGFKISVSMQNVPMISGGNLKTILGVTVNPTSIVDLSIGKFESYIGKPFCLKSRGNNKFVIDTEGHQNGGGPIKIYQKVDDMHVNQTWTVDKDGHLISWQNRNSILYLPNANNGTRPTIIGWKGQENLANSTNCKWRLNNDGQIESLLNPNQILDISGASYNNNTPVLIWQKHGGANQKWDLYEISQKTSFPASNRTTLVNQRFYIVHDTKGAGGKNYALDNTGRIGNEIRFYMWEFVRGNSNQLFTMNERGAIKCVNGNEVLDVAGGNLNNGATIIQWPPHGGPNQTWGYDWNKKNIYVYSKPAMQLHAGANEYRNSGQTCLWSCGDCPGSKWWIVFEDGTCFNRDFKPMTEVKNDIGQFNQWVGRTIHIKSINCQNIIVDSRVAQNGTGGHKGGSKIGTYVYNPDYKGTQNWTIDTFGRIVLTDQNKQWCIYASSLNNSTPLTLVKIEKLDKFDMKQYWRLNTDGTIVNIADPNKAFDMDSRTTCKSDGEIHIYNLHRGANQKWVVADAPVDIGKFKDWIGKPFYIQSQGNGKFVIDTEGHQNGGGFIKIYENQNNQHVNQTWTVDKDGHLISWQNRNSILYIEATTNGVQPIIIGWKGNESKANSPNAKWSLTNDGQIESVAIPSRCLDISGANYNNNIRVILWDKHTGANQKWNTPEAEKPEPVFQPKSIMVLDNVKPPIGSIVIEQVTDCIIYFARGDSSQKAKKLTLHNGVRYRPGKDPNKIAFKIDDFVKKYGSMAIKEIELKDADIDNKQTDKIEEYEGFKPFTDDDGKWTNTGIGILIGILVLVIAGGAFAFYWFKLRNKNNNTDKSELTVVDT